MVVVKVKTSDIYVAISDVDMADKKTYNQYRVNNKVLKA
jgi:hypothetical protein